MKLVRSRGGKSYKMVQIFITRKEASKLDLCGTSAEGRGRRLHTEKYLTCAITVEPEHYCGASVCVCVCGWWILMRLLQQTRQEVTAYGPNRKSCSEKIIFCASQYVWRVHSRGRIHLIWHPILPVDKRSFHNSTTRNFNKYIKQELRLWTTEAASGSLFVNVWQQHQNAFQHENELLKVIRERS